MSFSLRIGLIFAGLVAIVAAVVGSSAFIASERTALEVIDESLLERTEVLSDVQRFRQVRPHSSTGRSAPRQVQPDPGSQSGQTAPPQNTQYRQKHIGLRAIDLLDIALGDDLVAQVLDDEGNVLAYNVNNLSHHHHEDDSAATLPITKIERRIIDRGGALSRTVSLGGDRYRMLSRSTHFGLIQLARPLGELDSIQQGLAARLITIAAISAAVAGGLGVVLARLLTRPLRELTEAAHQVAASGDLDTQIPVKGSDEVGQLGSSFASMLSALGTSRAQQQRLIQNAAHELRTPVTSIRANLDFFARVAKGRGGNSEGDVAVLSEVTEEVVAAMRSEVAELSSTIDEVIEVASSPVKPRQLEAVTITELLETVASRFEVAGHRVGRDFDIDSQATVTGSRSGLERALTNLVSNAIKYGAPVTAKYGAPVTAPNSENSSVDFTIGANGSTFWVDDSGVGIPESEREAIFERFYRRDIDRDAAGSGLGLSIVADIAAAHGGETFVETSPTGGARVGIKFVATT